MFFEQDYFHSCLISVWTGNTYAVAPKRIGFHFTMFYKKVSKRILSQIKKYQQVMFFFHVYWKLAI